MRTRTNRWVAISAAAAAVLAVVLAVWLGGRGDDEPSGPAATGPDGATNTPILEGGVTGDGPAATTASAELGFRLSEGQPLTTAAADTVTVVAGTDLTGAEIDAVLDRLPDWDVPADDVQDFDRPVESLLPPIAGEIVETPFPPPPAPPTVPDATAEGPLEVLRFQPDGEVDVAPFLAVTFNEPMVPLATLEQLDAADVPVVVTPEIEGRWRWIGTRTLRFEVAPGVTDRLPAATEYVVEIPAGTTSANGAVLAEPVSWTFATPPPSVVGLVGLGESMGLDPVFVATFDQRVDPAAVLEAIELEAGGVGSVRLATDAEIEAAPAARSAVARALDDRWVAFAPVETLQPATTVSIVIGPGVPSLEGPRTSTEPYAAAGSTYGPLRVERAECGFGDCVPLAPFTFDFTNSLDIERFDPTFVRVEPAVPGLRVDVNGAFLSVRGATAGNTTYTVTLSAGITDVFGQTLGSEVEETFAVGRARPFFTGPRQDFVTTDPFAERPGIGYTTVNHDELRVVAWRVEPGQYEEFLEYEDEWFSDVRPADPDWPEVLDATVTIDADDDVITETFVDLSDAVEAAGGDPIVVRVEPVPELDPESDDWWQNRPLLNWVQATTLGVDAFVGDEELLVWTTDLRTGEPVGNAEVELLRAGRTITTDDSGLARFPLTSGVGVAGLVARDDDRSAMLPSPRFDEWVAGPDDDQDRWYTIDDREIYRPGETARIVGFVRELTAEDRQLELFTGRATVDYVAYDPFGNEIAAGSESVNALGGFNLTIDVPEASNTGTASVDLSISGFGSHRHVFQVQDFRTPEFEVTARAETPPPYYVVESATVAVDAAYFAGGPLSDAEVDWRVSSSTTTYRPPDWSDFEFGVWIPWWFGSHFDDGGGGFGFEAEPVFVDDVVFDECFGPDCGPSFDDRVQEFSGRTDANGTHYLQIDFEVVTADDPADDGEDDAPPVVDQPTSISAEATVTDVNRQAFASSTDLLVHPAQYYVGLRLDRTFVRKGEPLEVDATAVDIDGVAVAGREVEVTAGRVEYGWVDGRYVEELVDVQSCTVTSTAATTNDAPDPSMRCSFATELGGEYKITAIVGDDDGRTNRAEITQWVSGATAPPSRRLEQGQVVIVPDQEEYAPGDTAELLVQAPFAPASGLVTVTRAGIESVEVFDAPDGSAVVTVPIADDDIPNLEVRVDMVGASERVADDGSPLPDAPDQPAFAVGRIGLPIPPVSRTLDVVATPAAEAVAPGSSTSVTVAVKDAAGAPVGDAGVALIVVDEAVLSLSGYELLDPLGVFYRGVSTSLSPELIRSSILLASPDVFADGVDLATSDDALGDGAVEDEAAADLAPGAAEAGRVAGPTGAAIDVRMDFDALAVFAPEETTGADGTVTVDVELPDSLTRYRIMAVAVSGADRFGSGESSLTARLPIQIRPSAPRFLNFGDRFELPIVVQNQTAADATVDVVVEGANLELPGSVGKRVIVPANDRVEVRFEASTAAVGTARFRAAAVSGELADAAAGEMPVSTPATAEAFATYGVLDGDGAIAQPVLAPEGVFPQFGGLEITTSSTALQALTDAVLYLYEYRYDSADGYASRIMAVAALRDVLDAFGAAGLPAPAELDAAVARDIERLSDLQNGDGGWPYWQRGRESIPWVSVQSTHALVLARQNGYDVDAGTLSFALDHLRDIELHIPERYSDATRWAIRAYALYVRDLAGEPDPGKAIGLHREAGDSLQLDSLAQLWPVLDDAGARDEIERRIANSAVETAGAATFATSYGEDAYLIAHSDRRTDGIVLGGLVSETPDSDLVPKVVAGLLANQTRGRWNNAHENAFILLALNDYFDTFEAVDPDFVARAWLGDTYVAESEFRGRTTEQFLTTVPMSDLIAGTATPDDDAAPLPDGPSTVDLVVGKGGADGRLYYRLGVRYAPDDLQLDPRDEGFVVERVYEAVDDPADVQRDADGTWRIRAGASVRVRLTMVADARRTNMALVDPLPAGLEPLNPAFASTPAVPPDSVRSGFWWWSWYEHTNLRDDRVEAYSSYLPGGTYEYTYVARATTPGEFVVPPTRAEEIYAPEVFGRSASARVVVTG